MPGRALIDLGVQPMPPEVDERRRGRRWLPLAVLVGACAVAVPGTVSVPKPIAGTVIRASNVSFCTRDSYVGITVTIVNQEPEPVTITTVKPTFTAHTTDVAVATRPDGSPNPCAADLAGVTRHPSVMQPGELGLITLGYPTACPAGTQSIMVGLEVELTDGRRTLQRDVLVGTGGVVLPAAGDCGAEPNPSSGTKG